MISIITVNYKSSDYLEKLIRSIKKHLKNINFELVVVNNDKEELKLPFEFEKTILIHKGDNIGFGAANNIGAEKATKDWLLFLNPDVEFIDNSLLEALKFLNKNKKISVIGPQIIQNSSKRPQPWTNGKKTSLSQILFRNTFKKPWNQKKPVAVDWVSGTALLISKKHFFDIGGFDEAFFMYFEDQDLCLRSQKNDGKIIFYPNFKILHHDGKSWDNKKDQKKHYYKSQDLFFQKHHHIIQQNLLKIIRRVMKGQ